MICLKNITIREIHLPLKEPFKISSGSETIRRILLLHLINADGVESWSECVAGAFPNYSSEAIDTAWIALRDWVLPRVLHREFLTPAETYTALNTDFRGHNMAKAAVEMAAWDIAAQQEGLALAKKLGGTRAKIATGISLGIQDNTNILIEKVETALASGYQK